MTQVVKPTWLDLAQSIDGPVLKAAEHALAGRHPNVDLAMLPYAAVLHVRACSDTALWANGQGYHSAALGVLRQSIEALTLIDLGLQGPEYNSALLAGWKAGKKSHGEIRKALERDIWPRYGTGLWSESWSDFFGNLSRAIQPFAHYTPDLMNWQFYIPSQRFVASGDGQFLMLQSIARKTNDPVKAARIYLFTAIIVWTLGRLLVGNDLASTVPGDKIDALGAAIGGSKLLDKGQDWGEQFMGHLFFTPGHDWTDAPL